MEKTDISDTSSFLAMSRNSGTTNTSDSARSGAIIFLAMLNNEYMRMKAIFVSYGWKASEK